MVKKRTSMTFSHSTSDNHLSAYERIIEKNSLRLGCELRCHLIYFDAAIPLLEKRKNIREQLVKRTEKIRKLSEEQKKLLLTPGVPVQTPFASLSLSHCVSIGGFIISSSARHFIGLDLEQRGRAKEETVLRISGQEELTQAPSPSALWSAKEAAYKSIDRFQDNIPIRQISVSHWKLIAPDSYHYQFKTSEKKGKGYVCFLKDIVVAFALIPHKQN